MRARLPWILFFVSLALNISVIAGVLWVGHNKLFGPPTGEHAVARLADDLDMTAEQRQALKALREEIVARRAEVEATAGRGIDTTIAALGEPVYDPETVRWASIERSQPMRDYFVWLTGKLHGFVWTLQESQRSAFIQMLRDQPEFFWLLLRNDNRSARGG